MHFFRDVCWNYQDDLKIERKYGFSKMTGKLFVCDAIKNLVLSIVGYMALAPIVVGVFSEKDWYMLAVIVGVCIFVMCFLSIVYPCMIEECFNDFKKLDDDHPMTEKFRNEAVDCKV
mmetsp:Transcript_113677/g.157294  ORF Transcript_113677/g.157294 Transcript_113677/m.157294 type:complete len:117 (-) Transcript_113677:304-654(-)